MRALPLSLDCASFFVYPLFCSSPSTTTLIFSSRFLSPNCHNGSQLHKFSSKSLFSLHKPNPCCSTTDTSLLDTNDNDDDDDGYYSFNDYDDDYGDGGFLDGETESLSEDGVSIEIKKLGSNSRRIRSKVEIDGSLDTVWSILTDYEKLADFIPGLAVSQLVEKKDNCARIYQIGQQKLPLGLKFNAKGVLDCYEKDLEIVPSGQRREIEFKMIEGDFQLFEGKWLIEQLNEGKCESYEGSHGKEFKTTLSYLVDVKPKMWLPVRLVEGRLCKGIKTNLLSIRREALK